MTGRVIALLLFLFLSCATFAQTGALATSVSVQVLSTDRDASSAAIANWADSSGGYYTLRSLEEVVLRVPATVLPDLRSLIEDSGDTIVTYQPSTMDVQQELAQVDAAIVSRTESLERVLAYMEDSDVVATLEFERELRSLNREIEEYTGRKRALLNNIAYAYVYVSLSSRQSSIPSQRPSTFGWINTIDLYRFIQGTEYLGASR